MQGYRGRLMLNAIKNSNTNKTDIDVSERNKENISVNTDSR